MSQKKQSQLGLIGLSVMGANLASNLAEHNWQVAVYNRSREKTDTLLAESENEKMQGYFSLEEFVQSLELPRKIVLMVQAGSAIDEMLEKLIPLLERGDIVIDGGNSFFRDTMRREKFLQSKGLWFVGMGISGGEEGARKGPSMMPGGSLEAWKQIEPIFTSIAAKDFQGKACVAQLGSDGAGHYVKMVHNGIEYVDMQLIAEIYWIMKQELQLTNEEMAEHFEQWNQGRLNSFLIEITAKILRAKFSDGSAVLDAILDSAGSKGTGKWTAGEVLELGTPSFGIVGAVLARYGSVQKQNRQKLASVFEKTKYKQSALTIKQLENALYLSKILAYAQGYDLLKAASRAYGWDLNFAEISRIWQGGCIIRAVFLQELAQVFAQDNQQTILTSKSFQEILKTGLLDLRLVAKQAILNGLPIPTILAGITYFDTMTSEFSGANLIQAQRDFFGAHTFQKEVGGNFFHHHWA